MTEEFNEITYLANIVHPLLSAPSDASFTKTVDEMGVLLTIQVAQEDMGKLIGKEGNNAKSIRTLLNAYGMKHHLKVSVKIAEPKITS